MKKSLLTGPLALLLLASCSGENHSPAPERQAPVFTASIEGQSRAYDAIWEAGDAIGVSGTSGAQAYDNVRYVTSAGDGHFLAANAEIYFQDDNPVTFTAYWPYVADPSTVTVDTRRQQNQKSFDWLWAQAQGSKAAPVVPFTFNHRMSKLVITLRRGQDVSFGEVAAAVLSLGGFRHEGSFSIADGSSVASGSPAEKWEFANNVADEDFNAPYSVNYDEENVTFSLILFPQSFEAPLAFEAALSGRQSFRAALDFTAANADAGDTDASNRWVPGRQYNLSVTLHKTGLSIQSCTITPWQEADGGNIDAD